MRRMKVPPKCRANAQEKSAVRAPPRCRKPVGEGANRVRTGVDFSVICWITDEWQDECLDMEVLLG